MTERASAVSQRTFTEDDQRHFAALSGDWNPVHIDPVAARRTPYGHIVHGVHAVTWAINEFLAGTAPSSPSRIRVTFLRPIGVQQPVVATWGVEDDEVVCSIEGHTGVAVAIRMSLGGPAFSDPCLPAPLATLSAPADLVFADARGLEGVTDVSGDTSALTAAFPHLVAALGTLRTSAILGLSRVVGMECPGLHSVFTGLDVTVVPESASTISYRVTRHSVARAPVRIGFEGGGIVGSLDAFFRPRPAVQATVADVAGSVEPGSYTGQTALIIGGSRGLGEATAKLVAAAGGTAIVTYHVGRGDAERVRDEISAAGGHCLVFQCDAEHPEALLAQLDDQRVRPTHVFFFASPPIHANRGAFDPEMFATFAAYYVVAFDRLCRGVAARGGARVFYPSTVFLDDMTPGFAEYTCAKAAGEALCRHLAQTLPLLQLYPERLPRTHTDQTNSFLESQAAAAHDVMAGFVKRMSR
jgi:hypothetical protein